MPTLDLHQYHDKESPYVAKIIADGKGGTSLSYIRKEMVKKSKSGTHGDFKCTISEPGLYMIRNSRDKDNGYRLFYTNLKGENKFPFLDLNQANKVRELIAKEEPMDKILLAIGKE